MPYCRECGTQVTDDASVRPSCGAARPHTIPQPLASPPQTNPEPTANKSETNPEPQPALVDDTRSKYRKYMTLLFALYIIVPDPGVYTPYPTRFFASWFAFVWNTSYGWAGPSFASDVYTVVWDISIAITLLLGVLVALGALSKEKRPNVVLVTAIALLCLLAYMDYVAFSNSSFFVPIQEVFLVLFIMFDWKFSHTQSSSNA